jgi:hypothetical protein
LVVLVIVPAGTVAGRLPVCGRLASTAAQLNTAVLVVPRQFKAKPQSIENAPSILRKPKSI